MIAQTANRTATPAARSVTARMADFITRHAASAGGVTKDDLLLDFTVEEIDSHIEAAKAQARRNGKARQ